VSTVRLTYARALASSTESCWDAMVSQLAQLGNTQEARQVYESHKVQQRAFLTPITEEIAK